MIKQIIFFCIFLSLVFTASAWDNSDCICDIGMQKGLFIGQGNSMSCIWTEKSTSITLKKIELKVYDQSYDYGKTKAEVKSGYDSVKKMYTPLEQSISEESATIIYKTGNQYNAWFRTVEGTGFLYTVWLNGFSDSDSIKTALQKVEVCIAKMTQARIDETSLSKSVDEDEAKPGSKGLDYVENNRGGTFFWNIKYFLNSLIAKDTPLPWVEAAIEEIGAVSCEDEPLNNIANCYHKKAIESGNYLVCEKSYNIPLCYAEIASKNKDPTVCDKLREYIKWGRKKLVRYCYIGTASKETSDEVCKKYPYSNEMDFCIFSVARNNNDSLACEKLKYPDACRVCVYSQTNNTNDCKKVLDEKAKSACQNKYSAEDYCKTSLYIRFMGDYDTSSGYGSAASSRG